MGNWYQLDPEDLGCRTSYFQWDNCFTCPLPQCIHDINNQDINIRSTMKRRLNMWNRIEPIAQSPEAGINKRIQKFATEEKISLRTAWRWLERYQKAEGNRNKFLSGE